LKTVTRYDRMAIMDSAIDDDGFLNITACPIAKPGVFPYRFSDGSELMEAKLPDDIFSPGTVESANSKPITNDHPNETVKPSNYKKYAVGMTHNDATSDGRHLKVSMTVADQHTLDQIRDGKHELSIGFLANVDENPGEFQGTRYDASQKNIKINHIAIVDCGRAGHDVNLFGDSAEMVQDDKKQNGGNQMTKLMLDSGDEIELESEAAKKVQAQFKTYKQQITDAKEQAKKSKQEAEESDKKAKAAKDDKDKAEKEANKSKAEADAEKDKAKKAKQDAADSIQKAVKARLSLEKQAKKVLGDSYDFESKDDKQIKVDAIKQLNDSFDDKGKDDVYINTYFDAMQDIAETKGFDNAGGEFHKDGADVKENNLDLYDKKFGGEK
jgi:hypothetical protein